ncbi:chloride channel CLIC-like protein 1 [Gastrophryne carolinensis]
MVDVFNWILDGIKFLKDKAVGAPETEPAVPPPWSLESPFQTWIWPSKVLLCAAIICFLAFLFLELYKRTRVPAAAALVRKLSATPLNGPQVLSEPPLLEKWRCNFFSLVVISLCISIPWEWYRLYKIEVAKKTTILSEGYARSCYQADLSFWEMLKIWLSWNFSWDKDSCESYYKALMVNPFWEVNPLMAISSVVWRILVHPVEFLSHAIGRSIRNIMKEIPSQWQLPVFLLLSLVCTSLLVAAYMKRTGARMGACSRGSSIGSEHGVVTTCTCDNGAALRRSRRTKSVE